MFRRGYIAFFPAPCTCMRKYCRGVLVPQILSLVFKHFTPSQSLSILFLKLSPGALCNLGRNRSAKIGRLRLKNISIRAPPLTPRASRRIWKLSRCGYCFKSSVKEEQWRGVGGLV